MTMSFANLKTDDLKRVFSDCTQAELHELILYVDDVAEKKECVEFDVKKKYSVKKQILVNYMTSVFFK